MTEPDLRAVDELCQLALAARRLGCRVHLTGVRPELRRLLDLAGVSHLLGDCPALRWTLRPPNVPMATIAAISSEPDTGARAVGVAVR